MQRVPRLGPNAAPLNSTILWSLAFVRRVHVPRTIQFDDSIPHTEINGYKFHTEIFGKPESILVVVVHGGPGLDYEYLRSLKGLSKDYRVVFYDQRGTGLSPRVDKKSLTLEQSLDDLHSVVTYFSDSRKVKLIGYCWGGTLVVGYLARHPEIVSQAVVVEPAYLDPDAAKEFAERLNESGKLRSISGVLTLIKHVFAYPFVTKEDGHEGYDYVATKVANRNKPGPPYQCKDQDLPSDLFKRVGYAAAADHIQLLNRPQSFTHHLISGISDFRGDLMLISTDCSIIGHFFQEKHHIPKLPPQTVHVKAANTGHYVLTLNPEWSLQTIAKFFKP
jgi:proline iminopeptidase